MKKFNGDDISTIEPTLGFNIKTLEYKGYQLNVWDVGGQQTIRSYWRNYFEQVTMIDSEQVPVDAHIIPRPTDDTYTPRPNGDVEAAARRTVRV